MLKLTVLLTAIILTIFAFINPSWFTILFAILTWIIGLKLSFDF